MGESTQSVIDRIHEHFDAMSGGSLFVPEWKLTVRWSPVTVRDKSEILRRAGQDVFLQALWTVIIKALDDQGERLFTIEHRPELERRADSAIIERISEAIHRGVEAPDLGN